MSATGEHQVPASARLARSTHEEIGQLAGALIAAVDENRAILKIICEHLGVEPVERTDTEPIAWARSRAGAMSRLESIDRIKASMDANHAAAKRQAGLPPRDLRRDHSRQQPILDDADLAAEKAAFIARQGADAQPNRHAAMQKSGYAPDQYGDFHWKSRQVREAIYILRLQRRQHP